MVASYITHSRAILNKLKNITSQIPGVKLRDLFPLIHSAVRMHAINDQFNDPGAKRKDQLNHEVIQAAGVRTK